jgi:hypothetical protein
MLGDGLFAQETVTLALADTAPLNGLYPVNVIGPAETNVHPTTAHAARAQMPSVSAIASRGAQPRTLPQGGGIVIWDDDGCARSPDTMITRLPETPA